MQARTSGGMSTDSSADVRGRGAQPDRIGDPDPHLDRNRAPLKMSPPVIDGPDAGMFSVDQPSDCSVSPAARAAEVTVHFTPTSLAGKQAGLTLSGKSSAHGSAPDRLRHLAFPQRPG